MADKKTVAGDNKPIKDLLKETDAFLTTSEKVYEYVLRHTRPIAIAAAVLVAALIAVIAVSNYQESKAEKAMTAYDQAWSVLESGGPAESIEAMKKVQAEFPQSPAARLADFALVRLYTIDGRYEEAMPLSETLLKTLSSNEATLKSALLNNLGGLYEATGKLEQAKTSYEAALATGDMDLKLDVLLALGRVETALGGKDAAIGHYEAVMREFPESSKIFIAKLKLAELTGQAKPFDPASEPDAEPIIHENPQTSDSASPAADPEKRVDDIQESDLN